MKRKKVVGSCSDANTVRVHMTPKRSLLFSPLSAFCSKEAPMKNNCYSWIFDRPVLSLSFLCNSYSHISTFLLSFFLFWKSWIWLNTNAISKLQLPITLHESLRLRKATTKITLLVLLLNSFIFGIVST